MSDKTSWLYNLKKSELEQECRKRNLTTENQTVKELRQTLAEAIRANPDQTRKPVPKPIESGNTSEPEPDYKDTMSRSDGETDEKPEMINYPEQYERGIERWNLCFDTYDDPVEFLEGLDDLIESSGIEKEKVLKIIPRFLRGKAVLWYRNNKESFKTWGEFITCFKLTFLTRDHENELLRKIIMKKQYYRQKFTDYLIEIQTLMRRYGKMSKEEQLKIIYENMSPKYKYYIKGSEFTTVYQLIQLASDYESISTERRTDFDRGHQQKSQSTQQTQNQSEYQEPEETRDKWTPRDRTRPEETTKYVYKYNSGECCWSCGKPGHSMRDCQGKKVTFCSNCGKLGVLSTNCCKKANNRIESLRIDTHNQQQKGDNRPFIKISVLQKEYDALIDTGSTRSYVNKDVYKNFTDRNLKPKRISETATLVNGTKIDIKEALPLEIGIGEEKISHQLLYHPEITKVVIGMDILGRMGMKIVWTPNKKKNDAKDITPEQATTNTGTENENDPIEPRARDPTLTKQETEELQKLVKEELPADLLGLALLQEEESSLEMTDLAYLAMLTDLTRDPSENKTETASEGRQRKKRGCRSGRRHTRRYKKEPDKTKQAQMLNYNFSYHRDRRKLDTR